MRIGAGSASILLAMLIAMAGCGQKQTGNPRVEKFVHQTRTDFVRLKRLLAPALARADRRRAVDEAVAEFLADAKARAGRTEIGIAVLDGAMNYIAGREWSRGETAAEPVSTSLSDFSYLEDLFRAARTGIAARALYFRGREILTVCSAVGSAENPRAFVCIFYDAEKFARKWEFGKKTFVKIDFRQR